MNEYVTAELADETFQTKADMTAYLTTTTAGTIYQTKDDMTAYLTTTNAAATYQPIGSIRGAIYNNRNNFRRKLF